MLIRKLGPTEQTLEQASREASTTVIVTYSRVRGPINSCLLEQALKQAADRYPLLAACILRRGRQLYFAKTPTQAIPLEMGHLSSEDQWQDAYEAELNRPLDSRAGLSRVLLLQTPDPQLHYLLITTHHAISDGLSCGYIHTDVISACNRLVVGQVLGDPALGDPALGNSALGDRGEAIARPPEPSPSAAALPVLPPIEQMLPPAFRGYEGWKKSAQLLFQLVHNLRRLKLDCLPVKPVPLKARKTRIIQRRLAPSQVSALMAECTAQRTTPNALIMAAMLIAVARNLSLPSGAAATLSAQIIIDLRRYLLPLGSSPQILKTARIGRSWVTNCSETVMHSYQVSPAHDIWALAGQIKGRLRQSIRDREMLAYPRLRGLLLLFSILHSHAPRLSVSSSSVGEVDLAIEPCDGKTLFEIEDYSGATSMVIYTGAFSLIASQLRGELTLNFLFSQPMLSENMMQVLVQETLQQIEALTRTSTSVALPEEAAIAFDPRSGSQRVYRTSADALLQLP